MSGVSDPLLQEAGDDFGAELILLMIQRKSTYVFIYDGYSEDIGYVLGGEQLSPVF